MNDDFDSAVVITGLPFQTTVDTTEATSAADDPLICGSGGTVWFSFTPATDTTIIADTFGSNYDTMLAAYTGARGSLELAPDACNDDFSGLQSRIAFQAAAGTTYHLKAGTCCGSGGSGGGSLTLTVDSLQVPANDDFADAHVVGSLPFSQQVDTTAASMEPGEPAQTCASVSQSVWYSFTPTETLSITARAQFSNTVVTAFTGSSLQDLVQIDCETSGFPVTIRAAAGQTYYFQVGGAFGSGGPTLFSLNVAPPVEARFFFSPQQPSVFDNVQFFDQSFDPGGSLITERRWQFGDGGVAEGCCPAHRYAADGDYQVRLDVATADGRTGTATEVVQVRTHDVWIDRFVVPGSATVGQTKPITVRIGNTRYDETVRVELYRGSVSGFSFVGSLTQFVPARPDRTVEFPFAYTFTPEDGAVGKVTFRAQAIVVGAPDALPVDNTVISTLTRVRPQAVLASV